MYQYWYNDSKQKSCREQKTCHLSRSSPGLSGRHLFLEFKTKQTCPLSCTCCTFNPAHTRTSALRCIGIPEPSETEVLLTSDTWNVQRPNQIETRHAAMLLDLKWSRTLLLRSTPKILGCKQVLPPKTVEFPQIRCDAAEFDVIYVIKTVNWTIFQHLFPECLVIFLAGP